MKRALLFFFILTQLYGQTFKDGVYTGSADGHSGRITVQVTVREGRIADVMILDHPEYEHEEALRRMPGRVLASQSLDKVDMVSGATESSRAIVLAVQKALSGSTEIVPKSDSNAKRSLGAKTVLPTPVWVIGSYDAEGKPNVMTAGWVGICCSQPPALMVALRSATYTHGNIMNRRAFTVNIPSEVLAPYASYFGRVSGRDVNKFEESGLTPVKSSLVDAPYVAEFPLIVECQVIHVLEIGLHTMFVGEIKDVKASPQILNESGALAVDLLKPLIFSPPMQGFYGTAGFLGTIAKLKDMMNPPIEHEEDRP